MACALLGGMRVPRVWFRCWRLAVRCFFRGGILRLGPELPVFWHCACVLPSTHSMSAHRFGRVCVQLSIGPTSGCAGLPRRGTSGCHMHGRYNLLLLSITSYYSGTWVQGAGSVPLPLACWLRRAPVGHQQKKSSSRACALQVQLCHLAQCPCYLKA